MDFGEDQARVNYWGLRVDAHAIREDLCPLGLIRFLPTDTELQTCKALGALQWTLKVLLDPLNWVMQFRVT